MNFQSGPSGGQYCSAIPGEPGRTRQNGEILDETLRVLKEISPKLSNNVTLFLNVAKLNSISCSSVLVWVLLHKKFVVLRRRVILFSVFVVIEMRMLSFMILCYVFTYLSKRVSCLCWWIGEKELYRWKIHKIKCKWETIAKLYTIYLNIYETIENLKFYWFVF